jgi:hypothetical protein
MEILRKGSQGSSVVNLQKELKKLGFPVSTDGVFGQQTYLAVIRFQSAKGLVANGVVGKETWEMLSSNKMDVTIATPSTSATSTLDFAGIAEGLQIEEAAIRAVYEVAAGGRTGFLSDGRPMILFEGHLFWRELKKRGINPEDFACQKEYVDILFPKSDRTNYKGGAAEYDRLQRAITIHEEAALCATSWGIFQIMGFNHKLCGFDTVYGFVESVKAGANNQLIAFSRFLQSTGLDKPLQHLDWRTFAEKYNGPGYLQNRYDEKMQNAYLKYKK